MPTRPRRLVRAGVTIATGAALAASGLLATTSTAQAATACSVEYVLVSQWTGGFQAAVKLTNLGDPLTGWTLDFPFRDAGQKLTQGWAATWSQSGSMVTAKNLDWNGTVPTGGSVSMGLIGSWTATNPPPTSYSLNGVACYGGSGGTTTSTTSRTTSTTSRTTTSGCPVTGHITYTLAVDTNPTAAQLDAYSRIRTAMNQALSVYNCYVPVTKALSVSYVPSVATADGNYNGSIRFGATSAMQQITAMHEIGHTMGVGTYSGWSSHLSGGVWTGANANAALRAITGNPADAVHGDAQHFWPYGLNYTSEVTGAGDLINHCKIVAALRQDMGL